MNLIRSTIHMVFMIVTVIFWASMAVILSPFVSGQRLYRFCVVWLRLATKSGELILGIHSRATGLENLAANEPAVLLVKHQSVWETFYMPLLVPHQLAYVFKKELLYIPFFGWAMAVVEMIHIDRSKRVASSIKVAEQGRRLMDKGIWVIMFPEGTRIGRGEKGVYRLSGARLAIECGVPVVPVAVTSARCWPPRGFIKKPGVVEFSIGKPISSVNRKPDELMREVEDWIEAEMLRLDPEGYPDGQARLSTRIPGA